MTDQRPPAGPDLTTDPQVTLGLLLGFVGVTCFSLTLPATILALEGFSPWFVSLGRAALAGLIAGAILLALRPRAPSRRQLAGLAVVSGGVVFGFPVFTSWAMQYVPAAHGGVVLGILPLATAVCGAVMADERPSAAFWASAVAGSLAVVVFSVWDSGAGLTLDSLALGDLGLVAAVVCAAIGYAQGARLSQSLGGWQTICWALVISLPVLLPVTAWLGMTGGIAAGVSGAALAGFIYVALGSQLFGFFFWYRGLGMGGVARVSQMQLLQPFLTILAAAVLLGESIEWLTLGFAVLVSATVGIGRRMPIRRAPG